MFVFRYLIGNRIDLFSLKELKLFDWEQFTVDDCVMKAGR